MRQVSTSLDSIFSFNPPYTIKHIIEDKNRLNRSGTKKNIDIFKSLNGTVDGTWDLGIH